MHIQSKAKATFEPIAVIGAACRLPGAPDLEAFAALLARGGDAVTEIPASRWNRESFLHADPRQPGKMYTVAAGVLDDVERFDAAFFGISPREAVQMDPQQRLLLELTHEALEDAGVPGRRLAGSRTGVYVGGSSSDYLAMRLGDPAVADAYFMTGATLSTLSNRISYVFDFKGPSFTVDTACSSSLVALHLACSAMRRGEIDLAVVGGVNLLLSPQSYVGFSRALMLSPRGRCHAFAAGADGYVRAEGGGVVLLKPLEAALADGDVIRGVIEGTGVNSDGRTAGLSLPSGAAQAALLREVYGGSRVDPNDLVYVEAHGTGTAVGDPIEARALGEVLGQSRTSVLPIGSVKTNIGHLEAGSGMAGLLKAMLVLRDGVIPASLHSAVLNPAIDFEALNLVVARQAMMVPPDGERRAAAVNSFGFGGTNGHAVLSAAPDVPGSFVPYPGKPVDLPPLLVSARSEAALARLAVAWRDRLDGMAAAAAAPLLRAAARGREQHPHRLVATGPAVPDLVAALDAHVARRGSPDIAAGNVLGTGGGEVAFIYAGNGSQWAGMAADGMLDPVFRRAVEEVDAELAPRLGWSVMERLADADAAAMRRTDVAQPLLFTVQHACTMALAAAGVTPSAYLGHSVGEVAAALGSGALSLRDAAQVIAVRSAAQQRTAHQGGMAVLGLGADDALPLLDLVPGVEIAAVNSRGSITVAGPAAALQRLERLATRRRAHFAALDLDYAFHSAAMDPIRDALLRDLEGIAPGRTLDPFYSTVFGRAHDGTGLGPNYWWRNVRAPVRFADAVSAVIEDGCRILVEIGPAPVLQSYLRDGLKRADVPGRVIPTLSRQVGEGGPFRRIAAQLHVAGHDISGGPGFNGPASLDGLPRYPWQRERYWYERTDEATDTISARRDHALLGDRRGTEPGLWFNTIDTTSQPWLADHAVDGAALLPATAIVEMALAAARAMHPEALALDVLDLEIARPLLLEREAGRETRFSVTGARGVFELASRARLSGEPWTVHATGRIGPGSTAPMPAGWATDGLDTILTAEALYVLTARLGLQYGPAFQTVSHVAVQGRHGVVRLLAGKGEREGAGYLMDPARLDGALQGLLALAADRVAEGGAALLPWRIGRVRLGRPAGAVVAEARLRVDRVGPRSVSADVALLDPEGEVVATLGDCWFTRVGAPAPDELAETAFHRVSVPKPLPGAAMERVRFPVIGSEMVSKPGAGEDEAALLMEAYVAGVAYAALAGLVGNAAFGIGELVAGGQVHPEAQPLLRTLLSWLERDGMAACDNGRWTLLELDDVPPAAEIWRSILAGAPTAVAEAALAGAVGETLPALLAEGPAGMPRGLAALTLHMQVASPAALAGIDALAGVLADVARSWPAGRPLRVLEIGAQDGSVTARLAAVLVGSGAVVEYTAAVPPAGDRQVITAALAPLAGASVVDWGLGQDLPASWAAGTIDVVIGVQALTLARGDPERQAGIEVGAIQLGAIQAIMTPGGLILLAEPRPNRVWDVRFGMEPGWFRAEGGSALQDGPDWVHVLERSGFGEGVAASIRGAVWSSSLLMARAHGAVESGPARTGTEAGLLIIAAPGDALAISVAEAVLAEGRPSLAVPYEGAAETLEAAPPRDGDIVFVVPGDDDILGEVARAGRAIGRWAAVLADTTGLRLWIVVRGSGPATSALRGIGRVLANEAPNVRPYFLELDPALTPDAAAALVAAELAAPGVETEVALGAGSRLVPRLRRGPGPPATSVQPAQARLVASRPGLLDTLHWEAMAPCTPGPNQVGIRVAASGLNFRDVMWALGLLPDEALLGGLAGATLGLECAGTVTGVGPGVTGVEAGDRVMAIAPACLATEVIAPANSVMRLPADVGFAAAATVPVAFLTVCYALGTLANLQPGERVLIHGGAGGVGLAAIQYARHRGAEVFASAGSPAKRAMLRLLGVDHVLDSRSLNFADEVMAVTGSQGVDVVLNSLSGEAMERSVGVLRPFGRFLELGKRDLYGNTPLGLRALRHNVSYFAIDADQLPVQRPDVARRVFDEIAALMERGVLRPLPHRVFRFEGATDAFRLMQSAGHIGKIVLTPEPEGVTVTQKAARWQAGPVGTYLVTGGLSGFGLETARWLVDQGVRSLALLGRRGLQTPGAADAIAGFTAQGVLACAVMCDVGDERALAVALDEVRATMPPICGVVHAAMVLDDALLPQLTEARFARVLRPKLTGGMALDRLTRRDPVALFLLFSSITTTLGNPGQANYVAANAGLEAIAAGRRADGLPALSVGWGPIADAGYLTREQAVSEALATRMGGAHMLARRALDMLPALLASQAAHVDLSRMRWGQMLQHLPHLSTAQFRELTQGEEAETGTIDLVKLLTGSTPEEGRALVGQILAEEIAAITKAPTHQIDLGRSLTDLGMDSLMAVELRMSLERRFGSNLPLLSLADGSSIGSIAIRIVRHLVAVTPNVGSGAAAALIAKYEDAPASDEEPADADLKLEGTAGDD